VDVTMPPAGQDVTEYFLFTLQKGYCDYYATSMAVLARAAGLPSRLVIGYIAENYDDAREAYVITADQAHAWTEVYFPEYGWIPFEPTAGRSAIQRLSEPLTELPEEIPSIFEPLVPSRSISPQRWLKAIGIIILVVVGSVVAWWKASDWWLISIPEDKLVLKLYARLYRYGHWIGIPTRPGETPYEFAEDLIHHIQSLSSNSYWSDWLLLRIDEMKRMTEAHVILMFNPLRRSLVKRKEIIRAYKLLRPRLWLLWLLKRAYNYPITWFLFWRATPVLTILVPGDES